MKVDSNKQAAPAPDRNAEGKNNAFESPGKKIEKAVSFDFDRITSHEKDLVERSKKREKQSDIASELTKKGKDFDWKKDVDTQVFKQAYGGPVEGDPSAIESKNVAFSPPADQEVSSSAKAHLDAQDKSLELQPRTTKPHQS